MSLKDFIRLFIQLLCCCLCNLGLTQIPLSFDQEQHTEMLKNLCDEERGDTTIRIVFYNLENFYDTINDSRKMDDEFTPGGAKGWNAFRFRKKLNNTYKTLLATGGWEPPDIIGLCEVENRYVLDKIILGTPLRRFKYQVIHYESPDDRGVDVALFYRPGEFTPVSHKPVAVRFPGDSLAVTRDILYVKGIVAGADTIHLFVNHWPSRYGGYMASMMKRFRAAEVLRQQVDSLFSVNPVSYIIIMGDFNDEPTDESITSILGVYKDTARMQPDRLFNLMPEAISSDHPGTIKFRDQWFTFDQFIVSGSLLGEQKDQNLFGACAGIFFAPFLLEEDEAYFGFKPYRTFTGPNYRGGFSDHLPVYLDVRMRQVGNGE